MASRVLVGLLLGGWVLCACGRNPDLSEKPDVLLLIIDDLNTKLGCYGYPHARTPAIDALAERGFLFDRAYCQSPSCSPSRAALLSGLLPTRTGVTNNITDVRELLDRFVILPECFRNAGYETVRIGKILHRSGPWEARLWDRPLALRNKIPALQKQRRALRGPGTDKAKHYPPEFRGDGLAWGPSGVDDGNHLDGQLTRQVLVELARTSDKPRFIAVGLTGTHLPFTAPDEYFRLHPPERIVLAEQPVDDLSDSYQLPGIDDKLMNPVWEREINAAYDACVSFVDRQVGRILTALKESGREDRTIVVFLSDHGLHQGEHRQWRKSTPFEESCRVPLVMAGPGISDRAERTSRPVELIDLFPTLTDLCGIEPPSGLDGRSLRPLLEDPDSDWDHGAFTYRFQLSPELLVSTVRTARWRYIEWGSPEKAELYDHRSDPGEFRNRAGDAEYSVVCKELSRRIQERTMTERSTFQPFRDP